MAKKIAFLLLILACQALSAKVLIITHAFNRPDFIEIQSKTFKKFLQDEYEFVIFNDAPPGPIHDQIVTMCEKWNISCIPIPQILHEREYTKDELTYSIGTRRNTNVIKYSLDVLGYHYDGAVVLIDSDMFLIRPFSFEKMLENYEIAGVLRHAKKKTDYLWPGLVAMAMNRLPNRDTLNFNCGRVDDNVRVDTGGFTYYYLKHNPTVRVKEFDQVFSFQLFCPDRWGDYDALFKEGIPADNTTPIDVQMASLKEKGFNKKEIKFLLEKPDTTNFAYSNHFLHYRAASGWDHRSGKDGRSNDYNQIKTAIFMRFFEDILKD